MTSCHNDTARPVIDDGPGGQWADQAAGGARPQRRLLRASLVRPSSRFLAFSRSLAPAMLS
ncbi:hypothetical protein SAMN04487956_12148 [Halomonas saccharevitans]|uniref:Uncharacterized protein n=1 Tax=Halomonas saccharevitans TaxID=416872 RepID=A0A1I7B013_9GAMM|nr:hypothetical protein SAMN04487956_12148 [Halomonas saccharevitans]